VPAPPGRGVKPPALDYVAPSSLDEALEHLAEPGSVVLAGGQSLLLELAYRAHRPRLLVDLNGVPGLDGLVEDSDGLTIGALVRHRALEEPGSSAHRQLLARIAPYVAHPPIRARGTFCGSVAWAHPAAEWNAVSLALDAEVHVRSARGSRVVPAADWYVGDRRTARSEDELVTAVRLPALAPGTGLGFGEYRRTHASFAGVAVVAAVTVSGGAVVSARFAVAAVADRPVRLDGLEVGLVGVDVGSAPGVVRAAQGLPGTDHQQAVTAELAARAVEQALASIRGAEGDAR